MSSPGITEGAGDGESPTCWDKSRKKERDSLPQAEDSELREWALLRRLREEVSTRRKVSGDHLPRLYQVGGNPNRDN